jgi:hypothetical protein
MGPGKVVSATKRRNPIQQLRHHRAQLGRTSAGDTDNATDNCEDVLDTMAQLAAK